MPRLLVAVLVASSASLAACAGDDGGETMVNCATEDRDDDYLAGMSKTGAGGMTFTLTSAAPSPPGRDDNAWVIDIATPSGPFSGTVTVVPFMPDHRHGTPVEVVVTPDPQTPGRFTAAPINLWMPSLWEITIRATPAGGTADSAVFRFCIAG
ncbi:MAG TPA: hypothetical protein VM261_19035 [Kofleriaceae bacterium]|nr:hypothetical protein [Kofleriaceae bacterium]